MVRASVPSTSSRNSTTLPRWAIVVSKGQATEALAKRLRTLRDNLQAAEELDTHILDHVHNEIVDADLMTNSSRDVRTLVACCIAELLRLYAPDCPLENDDLHKVFSFFLAVLCSAKGGLNKPSSPQFSDCIALLQTLNDARCFAIPAETEYADAITIEAIDKFFDLVKPETQKNVEVLCAGALNTLLQFSTLIPAKAITTLMNKMSPATKRTNASAYHLAILIGKESASVLQAPIAQFFSDALIKAMHTGDDHERDESLHSIHSQIVHVNKTCPALLLNVVPQLEEELRAADEKLRLLAVRTLGYMFAERALSEADIAQKHAATWKAYLSRSNDKDTRIRVAFAEAARGIIAPHPALAHDLAPIWAHTLSDADEKVRIAAVRSFKRIDPAALRNPLLVDVLEALRDRLCDKKSAVVLEALDTIGYIYNLIYPELESGDAATTAQFSWILNSMMQPLMIGDDHPAQTLIAVQLAFHKHVVALPDPVDPKADEIHAKRLLTALRLIDTEQFTAFIRASNYSATRIPVSAFLDTCKTFNGGVVEASQAENVRKRMLRLMQQIANLFQDPLKAAQGLNAFARENDGKLYKLLARMIDESTPLTSCIKALEEIRKRLEQGQDQFAGTIETLAVSAGFLLANTSSVPWLFNAAASSSQESANAVHMLQAMANCRPRVFERHTGWLLERIVKPDTTPSVRSLALHALAKLEQNESAKSNVLAEEAHVTAVASCARSYDHTEAKNAAKLLCIAAADMSNPLYASAYGAIETLCAEVVENLQKQMTSKAPLLATLRQILKRLGDVVLPKLDIITQVCLNEILLRSFELDESSRDVHWLEDEQIGHDLQDRLEALRFVASRCICHGDEETISTITTPAFRLLIACLTKGEPRDGLCKSEVARDRIRYEASILLLKIVRRGACDKELSTSDYIRMSTMMQDESFHVRQAALHRLLKYGIRKTSKLPPRFYVFAFLVALDPEDELRYEALGSLCQLQSFMPVELRLRYFDIGLARFLHILNHHTDLENAWTNGGMPLETLIEASKYLEFFLDGCASPTNFACLHHIAHRCKGLRDVYEEDGSGLEAADGAHTAGLHALCDLAMCLIKRRADRQNCLLGDYAGTISLPRDILVPYSTREEQNKVYKKSYLDDEALDYFQSSVRKEVHPQNKRKLLGELRSSKVHANGSRSSKRPKAKASRTGQGRKRSDYDDTEDHENDSDEDMYEKSSTLAGIGKDTVSEDESVDMDTDGQVSGKGGSARIRARVQRAKQARNADRQARRAALVS